MPKLALIQQHASPDLSDNLERGIGALRTAAEEGAKLVAFPELSFTGFFPQFRPGEQDPPLAETIPGPLTEAFSELAKELGIVVIINLFERDGDRTFDSSPVIDADGRLLGKARMVHVMEGTRFHEKGYYQPGDLGAPVFETAVGRVGVAICYDRHYPEYMRALALKGAQVVVIPQAGSVGEWPEGLFEAEVRTASFQNGYYTALVNRVGREERLMFAGESFVVDPLGQVIARAPAGRDGILYADLDFDLIEKSAARRHFLADRRPEAYPL